MSEEPESRFKVPDPPYGVKAIPWRLPIWIYRFGLGWIFSHRLLLLTHVGRISGLPRQAVLEVIKYDPDAGIYYIASGFGTKSEWYQNITRNPEVTIQVGNRKFSAFAVRLPTDEAEQVFLDYRQRHPAALKNLSKLVGYKIENQYDEQVLMRSIPIIAIRPRKN